MAVGRDAENLVWLQVFPGVGVEFPGGLKIWTEPDDQLGMFRWESPGAKAQGLVVFGEHETVRFLAGFPIRIELLDLWLRKGPFGQDQVMAAQEKGFL